VKVVLTILQIIALYLCGLILLNMSIESAGHMPRELCTDAGAKADTDEPEASEANPPIHR
jgi:hypothetical protein